jgi:hypothetical protein
MVVGVSLEDGDLVMVSGCHLLLAHYLPYVDILRKTKALERSADE